MRFGAGLHFFLARLTSNLFLVVIRDYFGEILPVKARNSSEANAHATRGDITHRAVNSQPNYFEIDCKGFAIGDDNVEFGSFFQVERFIAANKGSSKTDFSELSFPGPVILQDYNGPVYLDSGISSPIFRNWLGCHLFYLSVN